MKKLFNKLLKLLGFSGQYITREDFAEAWNSEVKSGSYSQKALANYSALFYELETKLNLKSDTKK